MSDLYHDLLLEEARQPQHFGLLEHPDIVLNELIFHKLKKRFFLQYTQSFLARDTQ